MDIIEKLDVAGDKRLSKAEFIAGYDFRIKNIPLLFYIMLFYVLIRCKNDPFIRKLLVPNA